MFLLARNYRLIEKKTPTIFLKHTVDDWGMNKFSLEYVLSIDTNIFELDPIANPIGVI